jgi:hypothetical protein
VSFQAVGSSTPTTLPLPVNAEQKEWVLKAFKKKNMITTENFQKALEIGFTFQRVYKPKGQPKVVLSPTTVNGKAHQLRCSTCSSDATPVYHNITRFQAYTIELNNQFIKPYSSCASQVGADDDRSIRADMNLICLWCHRSLGVRIATFVDEEVDRFCDRECFDAYGANFNVQAQKVNFLYSISPTH